MTTLSSIKNLVYPSLFDGTGTDFNVLSGQVQGELDVYFLSAGDGGLSTTGQVVATTGLQVLGGTTSLSGAISGDGGFWSSSGFGDITASSFIGEGGTISISGNLLSGLYDGTADLDLDSVTIGGVNLNSVSNFTSNQILTTDGDATNCLVSGNPISGLFDGSAFLNVNTVILFSGTISAINGTSTIAVATDGDASNCTISGDSLQDILFGGTSTLSVITLGLSDGSDVSNGALNDNLGNTAVYWNTRLLLASDGSTTILDWSTASSAAASIKTLGFKPTVANTFSGTGTATTSFVVTIGSTLANTNYTPVITPRNALSSAVFNVSAKTTTTFTVTYLTGLTGTVAFDWALIPW